MKIGTGVDMSSMKYSVGKIADKKEDSADESQNIKIEAEKQEKKEDRLTLSGKHLNMIASSFVHATGANDDDNYSLKNLKAMKSSRSLMTTFNNFMTDLVGGRMAFTGDLIESGMSVLDAKEYAASVYEQRGVDAYDRLGKSMNEEELEKQAEESKEFTEKRTEEVVEEKQKEKAEEAKEAEEKTEEKTEEKIADNSEQFVEGANADEEVGTDSGPVGASTTGADASSHVSTDEGLPITDSGSGENFDTFV